MVATSSSHLTPTPVSSSRNADSVSWPDDDPHVSGGCATTYPEVPAAGGREDKAGSPFPSRPVPVAPEVSVWPPDWSMSQAVRANSCGHEPAGASDPPDDLLFVSGSQDAAMGEHQQCPHRASRRRAVHLGKPARVHHRGRWATASTPEQLAWRRGRAGRCLGRGTWRSGVVRTGDRAHKYSAEEQCACRRTCQHLSSIRPAPGANGLCVVGHGVRE